MQLAHIEAAMAHLTPAVWRRRARRRLERYDPDENARHEGADQPAQSLCLSHQTPVRANPSTRTAVKHVLADAARQPY
jgi:hypothetical protein